MGHFYIVDDDFGAAKALTSSSRNNSKLHQLRQCEDVVHDLVKHDNCWPFLKPVSKKLVRIYIYIYNCYFSVNIILFLEYAFSKYTTGVCCSMFYMDLQVKIWAMDLFR